MQYIMYLVTQETTGHAIHVRPYTSEGFQQTLKFAAIMAQAGVGPIRLEKQTSTLEVELIVRMTGKDSGDITRQEKWESDA